jgi:hypothetical protein
MMLAVSQYLDTEKQFISALRDSLARGARREPTELLEEVDCGVAAMLETGWIRDKDRSPDMTLWREARKKHCRPGSWVRRIVPVDRASHALASKRLSHVYVPEAGDRVPKKWQKLKA